MTLTPLALVVDPVSSGALYPSVLDGLGVAYLLLDTTRAVHAGLRSAATPGARDFDLDFGGSPEQVRDWAASQGVTYVISAAESGMELCEFLRSNLAGVPANEPNNPARRWNKEHMFAALEQHSVPTLKTIAVRNFDEVDVSVFDALKEGRQFVVKPSVGAGSVDVRLVDTEHDLRSAVTAIVDGVGFFGDHPKALVQDAFPTPYNEYVIDTFTCDGTHEIIAISVYEKHTNAAGDFVYDQITWLPPHDAVVSDLTRYVREALDALGVRSGPSHMEVMIGPNCGPRMIDFGARAHGAGHPAKTFRLTGSSQIHRESQYIAGHPRGDDLYMLEQHGAIVFFNTDQLVQFDGSINSDRLNALPGVVESSVNAATDSVHAPTRSLLDALALGLAFVVADDATELNARCRKVRAEFATGLMPCMSEAIAPR